MPIFIRRKAEEQEKSYYFVGSAVALDDVHASVNPGEDGSESKVVISTLKLGKPVDPELYRHLTGESAPVIRDLLTPISLMDGGSNSKNEVWGYESYPQTSDLLQYTAIHKRDTSRRT